MKSILLKDVINLIPQEMITIYADVTEEEGLFADLYTGQRWRVPDELLQRPVELIGTSCDGEIEIKVPRDM